MTGGTGVARSVLARVVLGCLGGFLLGQAAIFLAVEQARADLVQRGAELARTLGDFGQALYPGAR